MNDKKICRLCLSHITIGFSVLEKEIVSMIDSLTSIKINSNDLFPVVACAKCILNVTFAFKIQQTVLKSDEELKKMLPIKQEQNQDDEVMCKTEMDDPAFVKPKIECDNIDKLSTSTVKDEVKLNKASCVICNVKVEEDLLIGHVQEHFQSKQYCETCDLSCENIKTYRQHMLELHTLVSRTCAKCGLVFQYESLYNLHKQKVHMESKKTASTSQSTKDMDPKVTKFGLRSKQAINMLMKDNTMIDDDMEPCKVNAASVKKKCYICNAQITSGNLKKHISNHTSGPQICEICGATLRSYESLRGHMFYSHKSKSYTCDDCGRVFHKKYPYELHKKKEHTGEKSHICDTCGKAFFTMYYLNKHIRMTHLKLRPYICKYCERGFSSRFALKTHERQHTNEAPYKCEVCGEGFRQNVSLRAHRKSKHNIIEPKTCICKVCGKAFGCQQAIRSHMRLH